MRAVNPIRATGLQYYFDVMRLKLLPDLTPCRPSPGKELQQFMDPLLPATASSWIQRIANTLLDLEFLADLTAKLNELRGGKTHKISAVGTFTVKLICGFLIHIFVHLDICRGLSETGTLETFSFRRHFPP